MIAGLISSSEARIGDTLGQCNSRYGKPDWISGEDEKLLLGRSYKFLIQSYKIDNKYEISCSFWGQKCLQIVYRRLYNEEGIIPPLDDEEIVELLKKNSIKDNFKLMFIFDGIKVFKEEISGRTAWYIFKKGLEKKGLNKGELIIMSKELNEDSDTNIQKEKDAKKQALEKM